MYLQQNTKEENISTAIALLNNYGIFNAELSGYCESNGTSIYFKHPKLASGCRIRVSNHGISNSIRMKTTVCFSFDAIEKSFRNGGSEKFKSSDKVNAMVASTHSYLN